MALIHAIYRYPVKGLSPERLARIPLTPGETVPGDRLYAIENGPSGFDPERRPYLAKQHFLMLMRNERLARLRTAFDQASHTLTITDPSPPGSRLRAPECRLLWGGVGVGVARRRANVDALTSPHDPPPHPPPQGGREITASLRTAEGRAAIERYFAAFCADELRGPPKILHAPGHSFSDVARKVVSIINLASVAAIEAMVDAPVDPLRFRGNVYAEGWPAWSELDLVGKELKINPLPLAGEGPGHPVAQARRGPRGGGAPVRLKVVKRIVRCAATNVDPLTGIRDLNIPKALLRALGHADCGVYAEVIEGGEIAEGDAVETV